MKTSKLDTSPEMTGLYKLRRSIVIGLGGTGRHVCTHLKRILLENFDNDPARFSHVRFLSIDTPARVRKVLTSSGETVQLGREEMLGISIPAALDTRRLRRIMTEATIRSLPHANKQGTLRSRPIGHAFLVTNWTPIRDSIKALIRELRGADLRRMVRADPRLKSLGFDVFKIDIYMVGNLVSGTGSGMAVGMGYLVRDLLNEIDDGVTEIRTEGIFTVCGVYALGDVGGRPSPYAVNCYAALLELNHFSSPVIHSSTETAYDPGFDSVRIDRKARQKSPYDNVQLLSPSHSAVGELTHQEFEPHIAKVLALRTGSAIGMIGNTKVIDELTTWPSYDKRGNLRFCWAWGAHTFHSSIREILDLATALAGGQVLDALMGENVPTVMNRDEAAWNILNTIGLGYAAEPPRQKNQSFLSALLTPKEEIQNVPAGVSLVEAIKTLVSRAYSQPFNEYDSIQSISSRLDPRKHEVTARITGMISAVIEQNCRMLASRARDTFDKELHRLADFALLGGGCLDDAIVVIGLLTGSDNEYQNGLLRKESEAYQAAARSARERMERSKELSEKIEASVKSIAERCIRRWKFLVWRRRDYQTLVAAWAELRREIANEKVNEAKYATFKVIINILEGNDSNTDDTLDFGLIRFIEEVRTHLRDARRQIQRLAERFEIRINNINQSLDRLGVDKNKVKNEAEKLNNQILNEEWLRCRAAGIVKIIGPPYAIAARYDIPDQLTKDHAAIEYQIREHIRAAEASRFAGIDSNPTFDGHLQRLLEQSEPAIRINPNREEPPEVAYLSVPPDVPKFREEVIASKWLRGRIKNKDENELFQERADDIEPRVDVIMARLNFSPASINGIDKWAKLYDRVSTSLEERRGVHALPHESAGADLFFENLVETKNDVTLAYLVARCQRWLKQDESGTYYEYPGDVASLVDVLQQRKFRAGLGDPGFLSEFVEPLVPKSADPAVSDPIFVHAMRRFREAMFAEDPEVRDEIFGCLLIGVAQIARQCGELNDDNLLPKPSGRYNFGDFEMNLRRMLIPLGISKDLFQRIKVLKAVPALGDIAALSRAFPIACAKGHPVSLGMLFCRRCGARIGGELPTLGEPPWLIDDSALDKISFRPVLEVKPANPTVGQHLRLEVKLLPSSSGDQNLTLPVGAIDLYCFIEADGLVIRSSEVMAIPILPQTHHQAATVSFALEAHLQGSRSFRLEFFVEDPRSGGVSVLGIDRQIDVATPKAEKVFPRSPVLPRFDVPVAPRPEFVLHVETTLPEGNDGPHLLNYRLSSHLPALDLHDEEMGQVSLPPFELARMRLLLMERLRAAANLDPRDGRALLISLGRYLFNQLFPPKETAALRDALWRAGEQLTHWLFIENGTTWLPWELLVPPCDENRDRVNSPQFLSQRYQLSRWIEGLGPPFYSEVPAGEVALLSYASTGSGLEVEVDEISAWRRLLKVVPVTHAIADILGADTPFFGLHILRYTDELMRKRDIVAREPATEVSSPEEEIRPARLDLRLRRPLVSLSLLRRRPADLDSSCTDWLLPERVIPFLRAGASAVVGPSWPTTEEADRAFFSTFYQLLDRRVPLGEAFRQSRLAVQRALPHHPDWLAYTLFGNPRARPYWPESSEGYTSLECLNPEQPLRAGKTYFFRASIRKRPPLSHRGRLVRAESLPKKVTAVFIAPGLLESIPEPMEMMPLGRTMVGATYELTPKTEGRFPLLVYLFDGPERLQSLRLELEIERSELGGTAV